MSDNKKYYYLRLKDNFFDSDELKILESMKDGYLYSNILLKLYLRSLKNDGKLVVNDRIPYNAEMLASVTGHQVGTIKQALSMFKELGLIEILENGAIYMLDIQNFIGKGSTEADRQRLYDRRISDERKQKKLTQSRNLEEILEKSTPEIEIELEKEREIKREIKREIEKGHPAHAYGRYQNVFLTDEELADLQASFPTVWGQYIEKLSEYMASTGKRYQSHAATIRRWAGEDAKKAAPPTRNRDYSVKEDETV